MNRMRPRILIVEDDEDILIVYCRMFERRGFEALKAENVHEGIARLTPHLDFCYIDVMLPDGSGELVLAEIRSRGYSFPVALVTGMPLENLPDSLKALKPDRVLKKPYAIDELMDLADKIVLGFKPVPES